MTTEVGRIPYGEHAIEFTVLRRARSTLEIAVEPDTTVVVPSGWSISRDEYGNLVLTKSWPQVEYAVA